MKNGDEAPFPLRVASAMRQRGLGLREFCREVEVDPSFFSKVLSGKRSPPSDESVLRRIAKFLGLDAAELIVSAGRIPAEWNALWNDPALFQDINVLATRTTSRRPPPELRSPAPPPARPAARAELSEELL